MNSVSPKGRQLSRNHCAFTITELLVVIAVMALLVVMVLPVLASTSERSKRAACQNNLRQLAAGMTIYAGNNAGKIVKARRVANAFVQLSLDPPEAAAAGTVGLAPTTNSTARTVWTCPNRPFLPIYEAQFPQWVIGYQYFGGITNWLNPAGNFPSRSPVNLSQAQPYWTLAADAVMKINGAWGSVEPGQEFLYQNMPPHHPADSLKPEGGNQAFVDGSVRWIPFQQMYFLQSWNIFARVAYFYQDPKDFPASLRAGLSFLRAAP